jgi:hypothetical protein
LADDRDSAEVTVPAFQTGGVVRETGIALVHEGEYILPAHGSEAVIEPAEMESQSVVNYYFPVEVVIVGRLSEEEHDAIQSRVWQTLTEELDRLV